MAQTIDTDSSFMTNFVASETITKNSLVILDTSNNYPYAKVSGAATDEILGVALKDAVSGETLLIGPADGRIYACRCGAAVTEGAFISPTTTGEVIDNASAAQCCGVAMMASLAADDVIPCMLFHGWLTA